MLTADLVVVYKAFSPKKRQEVIDHADKGHTFYFDKSDKFSHGHGYQLRAITFTRENGDFRSRHIIDLHNYELATKVAEALRMMYNTETKKFAQVNTDILEQLADQRWIENGSRG